MWKVPPVWEEKGESEMGPKAGLPKNKLGRMVRWDAKAQNVTITAILN